MSYQLYKIRGHSIFLDVDESEMMLNRIRLTYETEKFDWLQENLTLDDDFVDIGANKGDFTLFCSDKCKNVYCVEPHPENVKWIQRSINNNGFTNIRLLNGCANAYDGEVNLYIGGKSGYHSIVRKFSNFITVKSFRLDTILPSNYPIVIKIDVEGAELLVLEGCQNLLTNIRAFLIDVDDGDMNAITNLLPGYKIVYLRGHEIFLSH